MTIETAQFVVQRAGVQLKCTGADLIDKLQAGDLMAVTRPGDETYKWAIPAAKYKYQYTIDTEGKTVGETDFELSVLSPLADTLFDVDWGDGSQNTGVTADITHVYPSAGVYSIEVTTDELHEFRTGRGFPDAMQQILTFDGCDDGFPFGGSIQNMFFTASNLTSIEPFDTTGITNFNAAFKDCTSYTGAFPFLDSSSVTIFANAFGGSNWSSFPLIDTSKGENFNEAWSYCTQLTSFPQLDFSSATSLTATWQNCGQLTSFPLLDTSSATNFSQAWMNCLGLTSFPLIDSNNVTNFSNAWFFCQALTSFPALGYSSGTNFDTAWNGNYLLSSFPPNAFDLTGVLVSNAFNKAFTGCAFTVSSVENILVSLDANGQSNIVLGIHQGTNAGKSTWTTAANTAYDNLIVKGWTISFNP